MAKQNKQTLLQQVRAKNYGQQGTQPHSKIERKKEEKKMLPRKTSNLTDDSSLQPSKNFAKWQECIFWEKPHKEKGGGGGEGKGGI